MSNNYDIAGHQRALRSNIVNSFTNVGDVVNKSMTESDFKETYCKGGFEIYSPDALGKIEKGIKDQFGSRDAIYRQKLDEVAAQLTPIDVVTEEGKVTKYVRAVKEL